MNRGPSPPPRSRDGRRRPGRKRARMSTRRPRSATSRRTWRGCSARFRPAGRPDRSASNGRFHAVFAPQIGLSETSSKRRQPVVVDTWCRRYIPRASHPSQRYSMPQAAVRTRAHDYRPSDTEPFMNDRQREYFREKLLRWKEEILQGSARDAATPSGREPEPSRPCRPRLVGDRSGD